MIHSVYRIALAMLVIAATPVLSGETLPVDWSDLPDTAAQEFEDPYRDLPPEQMTDLMSLVRIREQLAAETLTAESRVQLEARMTVLEADLEAAQIDVEWVLAQRWAVADRRRQAAVAVNDALNGQTVEIAGFLILAPPADAGEASAYLLPDRGVCNHLPAPAPNQLVRLVLQELSEIAGACVPVIVRGVLRAEEARYEVIVIDHSLPMWSTWTLETAGVQTQHLTNHPDIDNAD
jgi:hypothetical protein